MTSLTLALDNVDVIENTEQISKLFPKCRPRSDINLNPIIASGRENVHSNNAIITVMNIDSDNDRSVFKQKYCCYSELITIIIIINDNGFVPFGALIYS